MAIAPTGAIYKSLVFDGEDSRNYGVYITGEAVYNAPTRDVEMVSIPGRSGSFALDKGRFENLEVTYPAGIFADNEADFAQAVSDFRNYLCSRKGYCRLTDEYNPNEYRMAIYKSGLEVTPAQLRAGEFNIVFDCKPQRWLTSGEDAVTIGEWGDTETASGSIATFEGDEATGIKSLVVDIEPVQSGSGTPSPDNVRPISGWDSVVVSRTGKNYIDITASDGSSQGMSYTINADGSVRVEGSAVSTSSKWLTDTIDELSGNYILSGCPASAGSANCYLRIKNGNSYDADTGNRLAFSDYTSTRVGIYAQSGAKAPQPNGWLFKPVICLADELDDYTISLSSVGTVYGGTLDVVSGVLTVTHISETLTSESQLTGVTTSTYGAFCAWVISNVPKYVSSEATLLCSNAEPIAFDNRAVSPYTDYDRCYIDNTKRVTMRVASSSTISTKSDMFSHFSGSQVVYELATPQTVQLTAQQVSALVGTNNVWANSGDVAVEYGTAPNMLVNPTLFESSPLLAVEGYGTIGFNGYEIELENNVVGEIVLADSTTTPLTSFNVNYNTNLLDDGDDIIIGDIVINAQIYLGASGAVSSLTDSNNEFTSVGTTNGEYYITTTLPSFTRAKGTAYTYKANTVTVSGTDYSGNSSSATCLIRIWAYDDHVNILLQTTTVSGKFFYNTRSTTVNRIIGDSTMTTLGHPTYIDCDYGEAYKVDGDTIVSLNAYIDLGSDLPKLTSGANEITYDNTITELKIQPHWWKV